MIRQSFNRYSITTLCAMTALLCLGTAFTWFVDPYSVHSRPRIARFNAVKPHAYTHAIAAKTALASQTKPRLLLLGNSRIDAGINPDSEVIPAELRPAFNFAIPGVGLNTNYATLVSTATRSRVHRVILGLDFIDFPARRSALISIEPPRPRPAPRSALDRFGSLSKTTLSLNSLFDALDTVRAQYLDDSANMTVSGHNTFAQYSSIVRGEGHWAIFHQRNVENARSYLRAPRALADGDGRRAPSFFVLQRIIDWSISNNIQLDLVIYPYHAHILELFDMAGLWPLFEQWKRHLVAQVDKVDNQLITLWDFSGYHEIASEAVPARGDTTTQMKWYWEAGHFKSTLGDELLRNILERTPAQPIGAHLTTQTIDGSLQGIRNQRASWRATHQQTRAYLQAIIERLTRR